MDRKVTLTPVIKPDLSAVWTITAETNREGKYDKDLDLSHEEMRELWRLIQQYMRVMDIALDDLRTRLAKPE